MRGINIVYHASSTQGLKVLEPNISTHNERWVYATKDLATSATFIGHNYDLICQIDIDSEGKPNIFERFPDALEYGFENQSGSIYQVDSKTFQEGKTPWIAEVVSEVPVEVIEEVPVDDALKFLLKLEKEGKITIYRYPNTPLGIMKDKEDIIESVVRWRSSPDSQVFEDLRKFHPEIVDEVIKRLRAIGVEVKGTEFI